MACKTIGRFVYDSATPQAVAAGGNVPLTASTVDGCVSCDGEVVTISRAGTYSVSVNLSYAPEAAGVCAAQLYRNGNAVPGAHALGNAASAGELVPQSFSTVVTVPRNAPSLSLSVKLAASANVYVAAVVVEREG